MCKVFYSHHYLCEQFLFAVLLVCETFPGLPLVLVCILLKNNFRR